jgi:glucose/arabinose dehydrogenase
MKLKSRFFAVLVMVSVSANAQPFSLRDAFPNVPAFSNAIELLVSPDSNRIFVAQQRGLIYVLNNDSTTSQRKTFLDISSRVSQSGSETGLLGMAFHPNYLQNGFFYVYYTATINSQLTSVLARYQVSAADPDSAVFSSEFTLDRELQPFSNHNGGKLAFGSDGFLYWSLGDGGSSGDPQNRSQNRSIVLGKINRLDVNGDDFPSDTLRNYAIPPSNPFFNNIQGFAPEIYAFGLRNVWKFSFDARNRLWAADVGQNAWEEINLITNGGNYGWRKFEGFATYNGGDPTPPNSIFPVWVYSHSAGDVSITGGSVYRGNRIPYLRDKYIYADYVSGRIWALRYDDINPVQNPAANELVRDMPFNISAFTEDRNREMLVVQYGSGRIWRLEGPATTARLATTTPVVTVNLNQGAGQRILTLQNTGDAPLTISNITNITQRLLPTRTTITIPAGGSDTVSVVIAAPMSGTYSLPDTLSIVSNAANSPFRIPATVTLSVQEQQANAPRDFALEQNYPNPFNPSTEIRYQVAAASDVRLDVFDMLGRKVATVVNERQAVGSYSVNFNAGNLASGVYFYKLQAGTFTQTRKMLLVK